MRRFLRDNGLELTFLPLFALAAIGQAFAGHADFDNQRGSPESKPVGSAQTSTGVEG
ncbi:DUF6766 family protein [Streptomyces sp. NPDC008159]|uniref:DUF6766 family protein n=1 Tax=Streptomyces sp. NPDC008159 TaxID=3364817 RepID=UPI0036ECDBC2